MTTQVAQDPSTTWLWIRVDSIAAPLFNSRESDSPVPETEIEGDEIIKLETIEALAASMKAQGQLQPIGVRLLVDDGDNSKYRLRFGSRRLAAAKFNKWERIKAEIKLEPPSPEADDADVLDNSIENFGRRNLSTYDKGRTFAELRRRKIKLDDITAKTGFTGAYISKLAKCHEKLHDDIKAEWRKGNKHADYGFLYELTKEKPADQLPMWEAHIAAADDEKDEGEDDKDKEKTKKGPAKDPVEVFRVPKARYTKIVRAMSTKKTPAAAVEIVKYLIGKTKVCTVLGINDEPADK